MENNKKFCINCGNPIYVKDGQKVASCDKCGSIISIEPKIQISADSNISEAITDVIENDIRTDSTDIKIIPIKCPSCGNSIAVKEGQMVAQCQFCGNQFAVDDGTRRIEIVNEAQQLKNEIERQEYEAKRAAHEEFEKVYAVQKKKRQKWAIVYGASTVLLCVLMLLAAYIGYEGNATVIVFIILAYFLFMPIILILSRPHLPTHDMDKADTSKLKSLLLTWLLYLAIIILAVKICSAFLDYVMGV